MNFGEKTQNFQRLGTQKISPNSFGKKRKSTDNTKKSCYKEW